MRSKSLRLAALLTGFIAALGLLGYAAYEIVEQPSSQIFGSTLTHGPQNERVVALTYDDGPNPPYTGKILDVLEQEHVHATFFLVGRAVQAYPRMVRREVRDGDAVGNHTWDHAHLILMTPASVRSSLTRTQHAIEAAAGIRTQLMRPPFGQRDWAVMRVARSMGYAVVMWSVPLARDWEYPTAAQIAARVLPQVHDGSIIVLHDGNRGQLCGPHLAARVCDRSSDIAATRLIVDGLKRQGYTFVTIPRLMALRRPITRTAARAVE